MDWKDIEKLLCERAEEVCRHLLPAGRRDGHEWCVGSVDGEKGQSLRVNLSGKVGVWADFAGDSKGKTLIGLWCSVRNQAFAVSIREAKAFLNLPDEWKREQRVRPAGGVGKSPRTKDQHPEKDQGPNSKGGNEVPVAEVWGRCAPVSEGSPVWRELVERRGIEPGILEAYGVREASGSSGKWVMVFPYYGAVESSGGGEMSEVECAIAKGNGKPQMNTDEHRCKGKARPAPTPRLSDTPTQAGGRVPSWLKFEALERVEGKKKEWTTKGPEKCLFGMQVSEHGGFRRADHLLICEGEKDAMSWASFGCGEWRVAGSGGVLPVSVPFGAKWAASRRSGSGGGGVRFEGEQRPSPNREWLDRCWEWMQGFETIFVGMDMDEAGRKAAADIITEIGPRRCRLVELPMRPGTARQ
jgi:hypothetical protein